MIKYKSKEFERKFLFVKSEKSNTQGMVKIAMIAAIYAALTLLLAPISYGPLQFRVSEALSVLPMFTSLAVPGLALGCFLSNLIGALIGLNPTGYIDAFIGTAATLIAAILSYAIGKYGKKWVKFALVPLPAVLINAIIVGLEITFLFNGSENFVPAFIANGLSIGIGQFVVCYALGVPLMLVLNKNELYKKVFA